MIQTTKTLDWDKYLKTAAQVVSEGIVMLKNEHQALPLNLDEEIARRSGMTIPQIFQTRGEAAFRDLETQVIRELASTTGAIVSTGGGAILRDENVAVLKQNGRLFFLDRPLEALLPTADRPLGDSREKIAALYAARYDRYLAVSDEHILVHSTPERAAADILAC